MFGIHTLLAVTYELGTYGAGSYNGNTSSTSTDSGLSGPWMWLLIGLSLLILALIIIIIALLRRRRNDGQLITMPAATSVGQIHMPDGGTGTQPPTYPNETDPYCQDPNCAYDYNHFVH